MDDLTLLAAASNGDIAAFGNLFSGINKQLKSYLYRLTTDRETVNDLVQDTFIRAFDKINTFKNDSSFKTWVFKIATNLTYDHLKKYKRWSSDAQDKSKAFAISNKNVKEAFYRANESVIGAAYEIREHIDFCFTCISKTLPIEEQVALILKDVYDFSVADIALILEKTLGVVKHLLVNARKTMTDIFDSRCALVNKNGVCNQCSELNGVMNPKQDQQAALVKLELTKGANKKYNKEVLFKIRTILVQSIDPLNAQGTELHDLIMKCTRQAIEEIPAVF